jgi:hypothetical protein
VNASGIAVQQFVSTAPSLFEPYKDEDIHGGPPLVFIPAHLSKSGQAYYLGIFHFFKVWRLCLIVVWCGVCAACVGRDRGLSLLLAASLTHAAMNTHATTHPQTFGDGHTKVKVYHHYAYRVEAEPPFRCVHHARARCVAALAAAVAGCGCVPALHAGGCGLHRRGGGGGGGAAAAGIAPPPPPPPPPASCLPA